MDRVKERVAKNYILELWNVEGWEEGTLEPWEGGDFWNYRRALGYHRQLKTLYSKDFEHFR